ncbi:MAG TPA: BTAD domain-containing putative transcriptional regulator [Spirillospora sp.]|nr:BTAD domain-containing putative transcriptional regulator [Spirillospora sp.]
MEFFILGPVEARRSGASTALGGAKQKTLLAALLLAGGRIISDDRLSTLLWGEEPPTTSSAQIYTYVSRLRKQFGGEVEIVRRPPGYEIITHDSRLDYERFERLAADSRDGLRAGRHTEAAAAARAALALWRGPALAGTTRFLADTELPRLEEARMAALENRIEAELALRRAARLVPELTSLVAEYPLREQLRVKLMIALYQVGRQADAVGVFHDGRRILKEELGVDPGAALWDTYQAVLEGHPSLEPQPAPLFARALGPLAAEAPAMLPPDIPDFVGRAEQFAELRDPPPRVPGGSPPALLLLSGMPGVGKSALAVRAARARAADFPDGQLYADLGGGGGGHADPGRVLRAFLRAMGVADEAIPADPEERIRLYRGRLASRRLLVLLDNAVNERQVRPLLPGGGGCLTVITSRRTLAALDGVHREVEVLDDGDSLRMLAAIIGRERVAAEPRAAERIAASCGGLPLALRIAGARLVARRHWPLARLADRLGGADSLDTLVLGDLDVRSRVAHSYRELNERERIAYTELAAAGLSAFGVQAAAGALGVPAGLAERIVESLADASLLGMDPVAPGHEPVYRFHGLFMAFAREQSTGRRAAARRGAAPIGRWGDGGPGAAGGPIPAPQRIPI